MQHLETTWKQGSVNIFAQSWEPKTPIALVCLVHGMGEHSTRYVHVAKKLTDSGYAVFTYDQIGHGKTKSKRGHAPGQEFLLESVAQLIKLAKSKYPNLPVFLYGHSMGANVVANYVLKANPVVSGVVLTSPWFTLQFEPPKFQMMLARVMKNIYPAFSDHSKLDASAISRDQKEVQKYIDDPLVHDYVTPGFFFPIYEGGLWALEHASEFKPPLLIMHGASDQLTSNESTKKFAASCKNDITLKIWEGGFHELHNDLEKEEVIQIILDWLDGHKDGTN